MRELRHDRLGYRFRRQHPIPPYIADFACVDAKLIIEADGGQHADQIDQYRDGYLGRAGWRILRFWNNEILENRAGVLQVITAALTAEYRPPPLPSPACGGGSNL